LNREQKPSRTHDQVKQGLMRVNNIIKENEDNKARAVIILPYKYGRRFTIADQIPEIDLKR
jgi:hypothetical protein